MHLANLREEIALLQSLLAQSGASSVVTISGETLTGKTALLRRLRDLFADAGIPQAYFNLKRTHCPHTVLDWLADELGNLHFPRFNDFSRSFAAPPAVQVDRSILLMSRLRIQNTSPAELQTRYRQLTRFFMDDLSSVNWPSIAITFDHIERVNEITSEWLCNDLIPRLEKASGVLTILAGQQLPSVPLDVAEQHPVVLSGIPLEEWVAYRDKIGSSLPDEMVATAWNETGGIAGRMAFHFEAAEC